MAGFVVWGISIQNHRERISALRGLMILMCMFSTQALAQVVLTADSSLATLAGKDGSFVLYREAKSLSVPTGVAVSVDGSNTLDLSVSPSRLVVRRDRGSILKITGQLLKVRETGMVALCLRWLDYGGRSMITVDTVTVLPLHLDR